MMENEEMVATVETADEAPGQHESRQGPVPSVVYELGQLPPETFVTQQYVATIFGRSALSVRRAIQKNELPPPIRMFNDRGWFVRHLIRHLDLRFDAQLKERNHLKVMP